MQPPQGRKEPARGALAGVKADLERAKTGGGAYDPRGTGNAWSHAFLNQKPWHPLNFRNQIRKFDAEAQAEADKKAKEQALVEFNAEQEAMKTMSYLSAAEQERYRQRQSISFMYMKPPGLDAALLREQQQVKAVQGAEAAQGARDNAAGSGKHPRDREAVGSDRAERNAALDRVREDPYAAMLAARAALAEGSSDSKFVLRHGGAASPPHGGYAADADNQRLLVDDPARDEEEMKDALLASLSEKERKKVLKAIRKQREEEDRARQVAEAEQLLRAAGYDMSSLGKDKKDKKKSKKSKKSKTAKDGLKLNKDGKHRRQDGNGSDTDNSSHGTA